MNGESASFITSKLSYCDWDYNAEDFFLAPARFLWGGYKISVCQLQFAKTKIPSLLEKKWSDPFVWIKTALAILLVVPATFVGLVLKQTSFVTPTSDFKERYHCEFNLYLQYNQWLQSCATHDPKQPTSYFSSLSSKDCTALSIWLIKTLKEDSALLQNEFVGSALKFLCSNVSIEKQSDLVKLISNEILDENSKLADNLLAALANHKDGLKSLANVFEHALLLSNEKNNSEEIIYISLNQLFEKFWNPLSQEQKTTFLVSLKNMQLQKLPILFVVLQNRGLLDDDPQSSRILQSYIEERFEHPYPSLKFLNEENRVLWTFMQSTVPLKLSIAQMVSFLATHDHEILCKKSRILGSISPLISSIAEDKDLTLQILPILNNITAWTLLGLLEDQMIDDLNLKTIIEEKIGALTVKELLSLTSQDLLKYSKKHFSLLYRFCPIEVLNALSKKENWLKLLVKHLPDPAGPILDEQKREPEVRRLLKAFEINELVAIASWDNPYHNWGSGETQYSFLDRYLIERIKPQDNLELVLQLFDLLAHRKKYQTYLKFFRGKHLWKITYFWSGERQKLLNFGAITIKPDLLSISSYFAWRKLIQELLQWRAGFRIHVLDYQQLSVPIFEENEENFNQQLNELVEERFFCKYPKCIRDDIKNYYCFLTNLFTDSEIGPYVFNKLLTKEERLLYQEQFPPIKRSKVSSLKEICIEAVVDDIKVTKPQKLPEELNQEVQIQLHRRNNIHDVTPRKK